MEFDCPKCQKKITLVPRCTFQIDLVDGSGTTTTLISGDLAEKVLSMTADDIFQTTIKVTSDACLIYYCFCYTTSSCIHVCTYGKSRRNYYRHPQQATREVSRFKCVSKFWNTSISDPYFKKKHLNIHAKSPKLLIGQSSNDCYFYLYSSSLLPSSKLVKDIRKLDYPSSFKPTHCRVYCCCDGLALIGIWSTINQAEITPRLFLWNPSTGESILLPSHLEILPRDEYIYGLGYDATTDDYKILGVGMYDEIPDEILALKSGSWRKIEGRKSIPRISDRELCLAFVHGAFHWLSTFSRRDCLVSLNISNELYEEISLPKILLSTISFIVQVGVSVLGGKLCIYNNNDDDFCIWVLEDYGVKESWTKWFTLPNFNKVDLGLYIIPIYRFSDDEVLLSYLDVGGIKYRTSNRSLAVSNRMSPLHCDDADIEGIQDGLVYTESLISPKELIV